MKQQQQYFFLQLIWLIWLSLFFGNCQSKPLPQEKNYAVIPQPLDMKRGNGFFTLQSDTKIILSQKTEALEEVAAYFNQILQETAGFTLPIEVGMPGDDNLFLELGRPSLREEAYELHVSAKGVHLTAGTAKGIFYALQTLLQLMPSAIVGQGPAKDTDWIIPCVDIVDAPRYGYRGMHLDVSRHFFPVAFIKKYIDLLATYKFNTFHWHLTDDQGWRIEIKKYPKLQEIAAYRKETLIGHYNDQPQKYDGQRYGGFYSQAEVKEVVAYAQKRFITVIPEIEMPGHAQAAISAYPELACTEGPFEVWPKWGISENVYCPTEPTFEFLENVLDEVIALFPSEYIHIGGDECPKSTWEKSTFCQQLMQREGLKNEMELQSYFVRRIEKFIRSKGRRMIGWDEIMEGGIAEGATIMSWRGTEGGIEAAKEGHDVVMTPTSYCYFDYYQSDHPDEPLAIGGFLPLEKVYSFDPTPTELSEEEAKHILGAQANVWTEYLPDGAAVEYMALPRLLAMAEVTWTDGKQKSYDDFIKRLTVHIPRLAQSGYKVANHIYDVKGQALSGDGQGLRVSLYTTVQENTTIHYTLDGSPPNLQSSRYTQPINLDKAVSLKAVAFENGVSKGRAFELKMDPHLATGKSIELKELPAKKYSAGGKGALINGVKGNRERYGDSEWLGFDGKNLEAIIDLGSSEEFSVLNTNFYNAPGQWIYPPRKISVSVSEDGNHFILLGSTEKLEERGTQSKGQIKFEKTKGRFVKIEVERYGKIPEGAQGAGYEAWLFVDELELR